MLLPLTVGLYRSIAKRDITNLVYSAGGVLAGLALYSFVLWGLGKYGQLAKALISLHPVESLAITLALIICWVLARVAIRKEKSSFAKSAITPGRERDYNLIEGEVSV